MAETSRTWKPFNRIQSLAPPAPKHQCHGLPVPRRTGTKTNTPAIQLQLRTTVFHISKGTVKGTTRNRSQRTFKRTSQHWTGPPRCRAVQQRHTQRTIELECPRPVFSAFYTLFSIYVFYLSMYLSICILLSTYVIPGWSTSCILSVRFQKRRCEPCGGKLLDWAERIHSVSYWAECFEVG